MTKEQLKKEYSKIMHEAANALGRRETMHLYKQARLIEKKLQLDEKIYVHGRKGYRLKLKKSAC